MMIRRFALLFIVLVAPAVVSAQALVDQIPSDAMLYVGWRGADDLGPGYKGSNLEGFLNDSNIPQLINEFLPQVLQKVGEQQQQAAPVMEILSTLGKPLWKHPSAFFFSGVDFVPNQPPVPHLGILCDAGDDADAMQKQLDNLIQMAGNNPPFPVKVVRKENLVALIIGYRNANDLAAVVKGKPLSGNATFTKSLAQVGKDPVAAIYVDAEKLLALFDRVVQQQAPPDAKQMYTKVRDALGVKGLKQIICTSGFDGKDWSEQAFVAAPPPRSGILALAEGKPVSDDVLKAVPKTATMAGAGTFDLNGLVTKIRQGAGNLDANAGQQIDQVLDQLKQASGVDVQKDLLASLGDEWAYFTDPAAGGNGLAGFVIVNRLKDPAKFEDSMTKMGEFVTKQVSEQMNGPEQMKLSVYQAKVDGTAFHYLGIPIFQPTWLVKDGVLYAAAFPQVAVAEAGRGAQAGSILDNPSFVSLRQRLGVSHPAGIQFMDLPKTVREAYGPWLAVTRMAGFADLFGIQAPPMILPPLAKLEQRLAPAGQVSWVDNLGIHVRGISPFPGSTTIASDPSITALYVYPMVIATTLPALNRAREQANRVKSASNLRQIGQAAMMYANEHKGKLPPDLGTMLKEEDLTTSVFVNPRSTTTFPAFQDRDAGAKWVAEHSDYVWIGAGKTASEPAESVLAYEKLEDNPEGVNVLFADGHVDFMEKAEAQKAIVDSMKPKPPANGGL